MIEKINQNYNHKDNKKQNAELYKSEINKQNPLLSNSPLPPPTDNPPLPPPGDKPPTMKPSLIEMFLNLAKELKELHKKYYQKEDDSLPIMIKI